MKKENRKLTSQEFIDWAIGEKKKIKGDKKVLEMLDTQIALARKSGAISEADQKRYHNS